MKVKILVIAGNGINCEYETAHAFKLASADAVNIVPFWNLIDRECSLLDYNIICFPGGFSDGDDIKAGKGMAVRIKYCKPLFSDLIKFIQDGKLILGICNGFQILANLGLVPACTKSQFKQEVSITRNDSTKFENRWVRLSVNKDSPCVFTKNMDYLSLPVRHGEGKVVAETNILDHITSHHLNSLSYIDSNNKNTTKYPLNPNGSVNGIAGICNLTGNVFGLMPHPESHILPTQHPMWSREKRQNKQPTGLAIFKNAVDYIKGI